MKGVCVSCRNKIYEKFSEIKEKYLEQYKLSNVDVCAIFAVHFQ